MWSSQPISRRLTPRNFPKPRCISASHLFFDSRMRRIQRLHQQARLSNNSMAKAHYGVSDQPFEEEGIPGYKLNQYFPINIGETLNSRYTVIGKLGFGANSTVWLCRDLNDDSFVAIKVYIKTSFRQAHREQATYEHLSRIHSSHPGRLSIRALLDSFYLSNADGSRHCCLVHPPLHTTMFDLQRFGGQARPFPEDLVKEALETLLVALDFLHEDAGIAHCDIKLSNVMLKIQDRSILDAFAEDERNDPVPRKTVGDGRTIYGSRKFRHPRAHEFGPPVLCDLGEARVGSSFSYEEIQPAVYKAPEILLQLQWDRMVDIWNLACVAWDMIQVQHLFDGHDEGGYHNNRVHIGEMVSLLGQPSMDVQHRSANSWRVFDDQGRWRGNPPLSLDCLEDRLTCLSGSSKLRFLAFLRSMMKWQPEERKTARQLLVDTWLTSE